MLIGLSVLFAAIALLLIGVAWFFGRLWLEATTCGADVPLAEIVAMYFRGVNAREIVTAKIMAKQAGLSIDRLQGLTTQALEAHQLAGGNVMGVMLATIAAKNARLPLGIDLAMSIDLAGRDVVDSVRTSVAPKVIDCPEQSEGSNLRSISGVSKDGIELFTRARVTVRTNLDQLIGGATERTIIARVGQGIISAIGSTESFRKVLETPSLISKNVLSRGLDANSSYEIVSIDIVNVSVGTNIGAGLTIAQAEADMKTSQAGAESRLSMAVARKQEMAAKIAEQRSILVLAEASVPHAIAAAYFQGNILCATGEASFPKIWNDLSVGA
jgi:uncharacterized protein YqfA (UPF0365 family)